MTDIKTHDAVAGPAKVLMTDEVKDRHKTLIAAVAARRAAYEILTAAGKAEDEAHAALKQALLEAHGWGVDSIVPLRGGSEAKIAYVAFMRGGDLVAHCHYRTKAGDWSASPTKRVKLLKIDLENKS
jgi:hypothetical protein